MEENRNKRKIKILYLLDILQKNTDDYTGLTITEIFNELYLRGVTAERKAIYSDIAALREAGFEIQKKKTAENVTYHLVGNTLNGEDIQILCRILQCSGLADKPLTNELQLKLAKKTTEENRAKILDGILHFYPLEQQPLQEKLTLIFDAIAARKKLTFIYQSISLRVSPFAVTSADRTLYLIGGSRSFETGIDLFDFSDLENLLILDRQADSVGDTTGDENFDLKTYIEQTLSLPMGRTVTLVISVPEARLTSVLDDLAQGASISDNEIEKKPDGSFRLKIQKKLTPGIIRYLYQNSSEVMLEAPRSLKEKLRRIEKLTETF